MLVLVRNGLMCEAYEVCSAVPDGGRIIFCCGSGEHISVSGFTSEQLINDLIMELYENRKLDLMEFDSVAYLDDWYEEV